MCLACARVQDAHIGSEAWALDKAQMFYGSSSNQAIDRFSRGGFFKHDFRGCRGEFCWGFCAHVSADSWP